MYFLVGQAWDRHGTDVPNRNRRNRAEKKGDVSPANTICQIPLALKVQGESALAQCSVFQAP